jgi:hypothetical protein
MFTNAWAAALIVSWQARQAVAVGGVGLKNPLGVIVDNRPVRNGKKLLLSTWHLAQLRRSPGKCTSLKFSG